MGQGQTTAAQPNIAEITKALTMAGLDPTRLLERYNYRRQIVGNSLGAQIALLLDDRDWCMKVRDEPEAKLHAIDIEFVQHDYGTKTANGFPIGYVLSHLDRDMVLTPLASLAGGKFNLYELGPTAFRITSDEASIHALYNEIVQADVRLHDPRRDAKPFLWPTISAYCETARIGPVPQGVKIMTTNPAVTKEVATATAVITPAAVVKLGAVTTNHSSLTMRLMQALNGHPWCMDFRTTARGVSELRFDFQGDVATKNLIFKNLAGELPQGLRLVNGANATFAFTGPTTTIKALYTQVATAADHRVNPQANVSGYQNPGAKALYCTKSPLLSVLDVIIPLLDDKPWCMSIATPEPGSKIYGLLFEFGQGGESTRNQIFDRLHTIEGLNVTRPGGNRLLLKGDENSIYHLYRQLGILDARRKNPQADATMFEGPLINSRYCHGQAVHA